MAGEAIPRHQNTQTPVVAYLYHMRGVRLRPELVGALDRDDRDEAWVPHAKIGKLPLRTKT